MKKLHRLTIAFWLLVLVTLASGTTIFAASLSVKKLTVTQGYTYTLKVKGAGKNKVKWKSSSKSVASVSKKGKVKGVKPGTATITATVGKKKFKCSVTVQAKQTKTVTVKKTVATGSKTVIKEGQTSTLTMESLGSGLNAQETQVLRTMLGFKSSYPEGKRYTNATFYAWRGGIYRGGYGCAAFAFMLSDAAFSYQQSGTTYYYDAMMHYDLNSIRVGDILRTDYNTHSVIVLQKTSSYVIAAEANYNSSVHWGRKITMSELNKTASKSAGGNVITRYDTTSYPAAMARKRALTLPVLLDGR